MTKLNQFLTTYADTNLAEEWNTIQTMDQNEFKEYLEESKSSGRVHQFLQVDADGTTNFIHQNRSKMYYEPNSEELKFSSNQTCSILETDFETNEKPYRPVLMSKKEFIESCKLFGITTKELEYFWSKDMEMSSEDWENY
jgi:hypothetical protein